MSYLRALAVELRAHRDHVADLLLAEPYREQVGPLARDPAWLVRHWPDTQLPGWEAVWLAREAWRTIRPARVEGEVPVALKANTAEGGTNSTTVSTGNSGSGSGDAFSNVSIGGGTTFTFSTTNPMRGSLCYSVTVTTGTNASLADMDDVASVSASFATRVYLRFDALPSAQMQGPINVRSTTGGGSLGRVEVNADGTFRVVAGATASSSSTASMALNTWYRIEFYGTGFGTSSTAATAVLYAGDSTTPLDTVSVSGATTGAQVDRVRYGKIANTATVQMRLDDLAQNIGSSTALGPSVTAETVTSDLDVRWAVQALVRLPQVTVNVPRRARRPASRRARSRFLRAPLAAAASETGEVTLVGSSSTGSTAIASSRAPAVPAGAAADDVAVVLLEYWQGGTSPTVTPPAGFTLAARYPTSGTSGSGGVVFTYVKVLTAGDSGTYSFGLSPSGYATAEVLLFRGADTAAPLGTQVGTAFNSTSMPALAADGVEGGAAVYRIYSDSAATGTPPAGYTELVDVSSAWVGWRQLTATGTETTSGGTLTVASASIATLFTVTPAAVEPGGATTVTSDLDLRWRVRATATSDLDARWAVRSVLTSDADLRWAVRAVAVSDLSLPWRVRAVVTSDADLQWAVRGTLTSDADLRWRVRASLTSDLDLRWVVVSSITQVTSDLDVRWRVRSLAVSDLDARWAVRSVATSDLSVPWRVYGTATSDADLRWAIRAVVTSDLDARWVVSALSSVHSDVALLWAVYGLYGRGRAGVGTAPRGRAGGRA